VLFFRQPAPNNVSRITYEWVFSNSGASPINLRFFTLLDSDNYLVTNNYADDVIGFTDSANNSLGAVAIGQEVANTSVDLDSAILLDTTTNPSALLGIVEGYGPTYWWIDNNPWNDVNGATMSNGISAAYTNKMVDGADADMDEDGNDISDAVEDCAVAMQWELVVPASGSTTLTYFFTWGLDTDVVANSWTGPTDVSDWTLY
jgi:hypothetical protein